MGLKLLAPGRAGTIRRVVRRGQTYICGLCRSQYREAGAAQGCVQACWREFLRFDPVILRRHGLTTTYRCRFCARDFDSRSGAASCAADCRQAQVGRFTREQQLLVLADAPAQRRIPTKPEPVRAPPPRPKLVPAPRSTAAATPPTIIADVAVPPPAAAAPAPAPALAAPSVADAGAAGGEEPAARVKKVKDRHEAFYRDGARYVCKTCNVKHFTKDDVYRCFDSHT